jgi:flagellar FliJ protein
VASFRFRLQPLLDQKEKQKQDAEAALIERQTEAMDERRALNELERKETAMIQMITEAKRNLNQSEANTGQNLAASADYLAALEGERKAMRRPILSQQMLVEATDARVQQARENVAECTRQFDILMKFRNKLEQRFLRNMAQKEELELDEIGNTLFLNRSRTG